MTDQPSTGRPLDGAADTRSIFLPDAGAGEKTVEALALSDESSLVGRMEDFVGSSDPGVAFSPNVPVPSSSAIRGRDGVWGAAISRKDAPRPRSVAGRANLWGMRERRSSSEEVARRNAPIVERYACTRPRKSTERGRGRDERLNGSLSGRSGTAQRHQLGRQDARFQRTQAHVRPSLSTVLAFWVLAREAGGLQSSSLDFPGSP